MKKRILSLLLALAMVAAMIVLPTNVRAEEQTDASTPEVCPCGCSLPLSEVEWLPWDINTAGSASTGHYYLDGDYSQDGQYTVKATVRIVLDLRGNVLTTEEASRLFLVYGALYVLDTVGGGRISPKATGSGNGGAMMVSKDSDATTGGVFEAYGCTLTLDEGHNTALDGGFAVVAADAAFRMHGGRLLNMTGRHGGALAARSGATIELTDVQVLGCSSTGNGGNIYSVGTTVLKNCNIQGGVAGGYGGNICQPGGTLTVESCQIGVGEANGTSNGGGNICVYSSTSTITGCRIYSGYAKNNGGNLHIGSGTHTLQDCTVYGGTGENSGGNLTTINSNAKLTIDNCSFTGNMRISKGTVTLKNKVIIGLQNNGLNLVRDDGTTHSVNASGLTDGSEIYVNAGSLFTDAGANSAYFKGALRTVLSESAEGLVGTQAESGTQGGYCPHCNQQVVWSAFSTTESVVQECYHDATEDTDATCTGRHIQTGHYYLTQDYGTFTQYYVGAYRNATALASRDVVIDLNGYSLTGNYRAFYIYPGKGDVPDSTLTLLDSVGGSTVTGNGSNAQGGGVIFNESSNLNIYGGAYRYVPKDGRTVNGGGVIFNSGVLNIHGGTFDGSAYANADYHGGAIIMYNTDKVLNITGGMFIGGSAEDGGAIYCGYDNTVSITGGILRGGKAAVSGGNLRLYSSGSSHAKGVLTLRDCAFRDGYATKSAGNMDLQYYTATVENCLIAGGSSDSYAGNTNLAGSVTVTLQNCALLSGTSPKGGNLYTATTNTDILIRNCLVYGGTATTTSGGNLYANNGRITVENTEFSFGSATQHGGNIYANAGNVSAESDNFLRLGKGSSLLRGSAEHGGNLSSKGVTYLNDLAIRGGTAQYGQDVYLCEMGNQQRLVIGEDLTSDFILFAHASHLSESIFADPIANTECATLNATIRLENVPGLPVVSATGGMLVLGSVCVVAPDGSTWAYGTTQEAVAACDDDSYIKLFADSTLVLTKDCTVDLNGCTATVSGAYTLRGMDSSGDDFSIPTGKVIAAAETAVTADYTALNGNRYLTVDNAFHRVQLEISKVNLRPSCDGIYYTGTWSCDDTIRPMVDSYGIAVSLEDMPGEDFASEESNLWTAFQGASLVSGEQKPGAIISGILQQDNTAEQNDWNGKANIFATAYLQLTDGTVLVSDAPGFADDIYFSIHSLMQTLDGLIAEQPKQFGRLTAPARAFYEKWADLMAGWELRKIPTPVDDGVIDVLMIGNSFCTYFPEELYAIATAAGVPMRVCNLYYGGCSLQQHYTWWLDDSAPYKYFNCDENGRVSTLNVSLEWALAQQEWDVLSIQEVSSRLRNTSAADALEMTATYRQALIPYLQERFPNATVYWHQTWAYQKGFTSTSYSCTTTEEQKAYAARQREFSLAVCEEFNMPRVPSGPAWEIIRDSGYDGMCARLGKSDGDILHAGDYYHDGDIGGGQYLNAAVWFETITGQSVIGNTYVPTYTYGGTTFPLNEGITVEALQNAAHQAVADYRAEQNEN